MQGRTLDSSSPLPRYYQIYSALLAMIEAKELEVGGSLPPERHIADAFGVSRPTVVKALDLLAQEGRIEKQQGRGNIILETDLAKQPKNLAFVASPTIANELVMGISQKAFEHGCQLQILGIDHSYGQLGNYLEACLKNGVEGFIIYGRSVTQDAQIYARLLAKGVPMVMVDRYYPELSCDHVVYENVEASYDLTLQLLNHGHQRIAIIPGQEIDTTAVQDRLKGYRKALESAHVDYNEELVWLDIYNNFLPMQHSGMGFQEALRAKLEQFKPTALLTINDLIANYVVHDLLLMKDDLVRSALGGEAEPAASILDLEIASFGTTAISNYTYLKAFAVHPTLELGKAAASLLISRLDNPSPPEIKHLTLPMKIVECFDEPKVIREEVSSG